MRKYFQKKTLQDLSRFYIWYFILFFVLLRIPSLIEPMWYADEGIYAVIANAMTEGKMLYSEVWDNKPPLLYILYFLTQNLFGIKLLSIIFGAGAVYLFYRIAKILFEKELSVALSCLIFIFLLGSPFLEGNIANAENFMLLPILGAFFVLLKKKELSIKSGAGAGVLFFIALLLKFVAIFDIITWIIFAVVREINQKGKFASVQFKKSIIAFLATLVVLSTTLLGVFLVLGILPAFIDAVLLKNVMYVSEKNSSGFGHSLLIIKSLMLLLFSSALIFYRKRIRSEGLFILLWLGFSIFNVFFSERYFGHYLLLLTPALALLFGLTLEFKGKARILYTIVFIGVVLFVGQTFEFFERIGGYYRNYFSFVFLGKRIDEYQSFFDSTTPRNYEIARILEVTGNDKNVMVWSDGGQVYDLLNQAPFGKYVVAYHVLFYKDAYDETKALLAKQKPDVIVEVTQIPEELDVKDGYEELLRVEGVKIYGKQ